VVFQPLGLVCGDNLEEFGDVAGVSLGCYKQSLTDDSGGAQKTTVPMGAWAVKARFLTFHMGMRTVLEIELVSTFM
jgi:hypothetical protein